MTNHLTGGPPVSSTHMCMHMHIHMHMHMSTTDYQLILKIQTKNAKHRKE